MDERESYRPFLLPYLEEVPNTREGGSTSKAHSFPPQGLQRGDRGKTNSSGHNVLFLPHWGPETPTGALASEISRYIWKNQEYWTVGTHPWGQQKKVITQGKDKFAVILIIEFWLSGIQSLDPRNGEEQSNG